ncbi:hypothetical protein BJV82DRAFT_534896 [Fennellomyces sp. T-0311]|nr:hypothetical protein BJV82DRAFT_534896 [Fennellomyces sp. T-0311]
MATNSERVYFVSGTGSIGTVAIKKLLENGVAVTVYARSPAKAQSLFGNPSNLTIVEGDYSDLKPFDETIAGHTRLFLVVADPVNFTKLKVAIAKKAYAAGVKQIVDISSVGSAFPWRSSWGSTLYRDAEEALLGIPGRGAYVALRPYQFMSNQATREVHTIKGSNSIIDIAAPDAVQEWISTNDIGEVVANIFQDPIEKHGDAVYDMVGDVVSRKDRAALLSKLLGRTITYEQITPEQQYNNLVSLGLTHLQAYTVLDLPTISGKVTPGLSILLGRPPQTLEEWLEENKAAFV